MYTMLCVLLFQAHVQPSYFLCSQEELDNALEDRGTQELPQDTVCVVTSEGTAFWEDSDHDGLPDYDFGQE